MQTITRGVFTSEFWLSLLALLFPVLDRIIEVATAAAQHSGSLWLGLLGAIVAAAYTYGRSLVKAAAQSAQASASLSNVLNLAARGAAATLNPAVSPNDVANAAKTVPPNAWPR